MGPNADSISITASTVGPGGFLVPFDNSVEVPLGDEVNPRHGRFEATQGATKDLAPPATADHGDFLRNERSSCGSHGLGYSFGSVPSGASNNNSCCAQ